MDLQGTPIGQPARGVKVTTDPQSNQRIEEPSGPVVKDSLAAESVNSGGSFAENRGAQPIGATSQNTTTNTTDTSAASKLPSADNARERGNPHGQSKYPEALGGQGDYPGAHVPETGYVGGPTAAKKDLGLNKEYPASEKLEQPQSQTQRNAAPASGSQRQTRSATAAQREQNYSSAAAAGQGSERFPNDPKYNASFNSDIGSEQDPGRLAEQKFQRREAETVAAAAAPAQKGTGDQTWYTPLNADQRA
ncbi:uncharacterized protein BDV17DRAFT_248497 [Aspergillus undulatus]|uniref:uncharacterized protein n=1 Tax=Aspergillus undulatus TaxID=1810928 RepID=UPI003CCE4C48